MNCHTIVSGFCFRFSTYIVQVQIKILNLCQTKAEAAKENVEAVETEAKKPVEDQKNETKDEKEFIGPSEAMKTLLKTLEFNAVDMYR